MVTKTNPPVHPPVAYCPFCGSNAVKQVKGVPRCGGCGAVFFAQFSRYVRPRRSSSHQGSKHAPRPEAAGFLVSFERVSGSMLRSSFFPDVRAFQPAIPSEEEAWLVAQEFAAKTHGQCVNVFVVRSDFTPVAGWQDRMILNR